MSYYYYYYYYHHHHHHRHYYYCYYYYHYYPLFLTVNVGSGALVLSFKSMTSDRKHLSEDISCTKQCLFLQHRDMHFNPEIIDLGMQIVRNGAKGKPITTGTTSATL